MIQLDLFQDLHQKISYKGQKVDLVGKRFNRYVVLEKIRSDLGIRWRCQCDCGEIRILDSSRLLQNKVVSCGCYNIERTKEKNTKHGKRNSRIYIIWNGLKERCYNKNCKDYPRYGARGITVCDEWINSFENFYRDMSDPEKGMSIDRIDNDKGYFKENCRWATNKEQCNNRRNGRKVIFRGEEWSIFDLWEKYCSNSGMHPSTIYRRIDKGMNIEDALFKEPMQLCAPKNLCAI